MAHEPARVGMPRVVAGVVARPGLRSRLDERPRLTVVRAPAGIGKSTVVTDWLAGPTVAGDVLWVSRAIDIASRAGYWESVLGELDRFGVRFAAGSLTDANARATARAAFAGLERPFLLVLDNFGPPGDYWSQIGRDLVEVLGAVPELSAIVIGRAPLWLEEDEAGASVVILEDELLLAPADARRLADAMGITGIGDVELAELLESAHGIVHPFRFALEAAAHPGQAVAGDAIIARELHERGEGVAAIPFALRGRDFDLAAELLVTHIVEFDQGDRGTLTDLVAQIAPADLTANPGLALLGSLLPAVLASDRAGAREAFASAAEASRSRRRQPTTARHRFALAAGEAIAQRALGRSTDAVAAVRDVLAAARDMSRGERASMGTAYPMLLGQAGLSAFYALEPSLAHACFDAELEASPRATFGRRRNVALGNLAMLAALGGRMRRAERFLTAIVDANWALERRGARPSAPYAIAAAYVAFNRGDLSTGERLLDEFGDDRPPISENWALTAVARAVSRMLAGEPRAAEAALVAADAAHRSPAERAGAEVAAVGTMIDFLELVTCDRVIVPARDSQVGGRAAVMLLTVRAIRAVLGGRSQTANEFLGRATRFGTSPFQALSAALAAVIVARRTSTDLRAPAERVARIVVADGLAWPLAILDQEDRGAILAELAGTDDAETMRRAFDRIPATVQLTPELIELHARELVVLRDLAGTASRAELAKRSAVSLNTIKTQLRSLYRKLGANDRETALARAAELGLIDGQGPS